MKNNEYYWIYILELTNKRYYTGYTVDLVQRYLRHLSGKGGKLTRSFRPVGIMQCWKVYESKGIALKIEGLIKKLSRIEKNDIIKHPKNLKSVIEKKTELSLKIFTYDTAKVEKNINEIVLKKNDCK